MKQIHYPFSGHRISTFLCGKTSLSTDVVQLTLYPQQQMWGSDPGHTVSMFHQPGHSNGSSNRLWLKLAQGNLIQRFLLEVFGKRKYFSILLTSKNVNFEFPEDIFSSHGEILPGASSEGCRTEFWEWGEVVRGEKLRKEGKGRKKRETDFTAWRNYLSPESNCVWRVFLNFPGIESTQFFFQVCASLSWNGITWN